MRCCNSVPFFWARVRKKEALCCSEQMDQGVRDSYPQPPAHYKLFAEQQLEPPPIPPPEADLYVYGRSLYEVSSFGQQVAKSPQSPEKYFSERTKAVRDNLLMDPDNFSTYFLQFSCSEPFLLETSERRHGSLLEPLCWLVHVCLETAGFELRVRMHFFRFSSLC